jgi:hypothetical protein
MYVKTPWSRNQIVALAELTRLDTLYQSLGEDAAAQVQVCSNALRERVLACGGRHYPSASHQTLAVFGNPRRALDWVEQTSTTLMPLLSGLPLAARPGLVVGFDCADTGARVRSLIIIFNLVTCYKITSVLRNEFAGYRPVNPINVPLQPHP